MVARWCGSRRGGQGDGAIADGEGGTTKMVAQFVLCSYWEDLWRPMWHDVRMVRVAVATVVGVSL